MSVAVKDVKFEHHTQSLGLGLARPRISWRFAGDIRDWTQEAYELELLRSGTSSTAAARECYKVLTAESVLVPWPGPSLLSREEVVVRVRSFGGGIVTPWSEPQHVEAGLLQSSDWRALLIETSHEIDATQAHPPTLFRQSFRLDEKPVRARLYITAHGVYEAEINGRRVGDHVLAPGWTVYQHELQYQTFDVTEYLQQGLEHVLGVHVAEGWYCGRIGFEGGQHNIWGSRIGVISQLEVMSENGKRTIVSDSSWRYDDSPIISSSIYNGEIYDMNRERSGWSSPGFNDSAWRAVTVRNHDISRLRAPDGPPIRVVEYVSVMSVSQSPSGKTILDFGQNLVGVVRIRVPEGPKGHQITIVHTEVLEHGECATRPLRLAKSTDTLTLPAEDNGSVYWQPHFTFHGFRYVQLDNWPADKLDPSAFTAAVIHTDMRQTGSFETSNELLNRLHKNVIWSMKGNFVGIPTDCPQRDERLGWTGDIQAFAPTATFLYDCQGMLKSWLRNLAYEQKDGGNGSPPVFSPNTMRHWPIPLFPLAIWGDATVLVPWDLYQASGDAELLSAQLDSMTDWVERGIPRNEKGLWGKTMAQLGDWLDPIAPPDRPGHGATDAEYVANAFLIHVTDTMYQICTVLGLKDEATANFNKAASLREAFAAEYITQTGRVTSDSQSALALAIHFGLFPTLDQQNYAASRLEHLVCVRSRFKIATGFAGTPIIGHALSKVDRSQLFYRMLMNTKAPSWLYPVSMGATTIWERWDSMMPDGTINPGEMTSFNHYALGAVADWMHSQIGGLRALEPGWKRFRIAPVPGGRLEFATVSFESPYGTISSTWRVDGARLVLEITVPPNTRAEVHLGCEQVKEVGSGKHVFWSEYTEPARPSLPPPLPFTTEDDDPNSLN